MDSLQFVGFLFLLAYVFLSGGQTLVNKMYQLRVKNTLVATVFYVMVMCFSSSIGFWVLAGFKLEGDKTMFIIAFICAIKAVLQNFFAIFCMTYANLAAMSIAQNAGSLVIPALFGFIFLHEEITPLRILGILIIMAAFVVSFIGKRSEGEDAKKNGLLGTLSCVAMFFILGIGNVIHKSFTMSGSTASNATYLTWVNIFMFPMTVLVLFWIKAKRGETMRELTKDLKIKPYGLVALGTVIGTTGMVCSLRSMELMDIAIYSPLYSALFIVFMVASSRLIFKEKLTKYNYISVVLALISVAVTAFA